MIRKAIVFSFVALTLCATGCGNKNKVKAVEPKDQLHITVARFDRDLIQMDTNNIGKGIAGLKQKYPLMTQAFITQVLGLNENDSVHTKILFRKFLGDKVFAGVYKKTLQTFTDVSDVENGLSAGFSSIHATFPSLRIPQVYFFVSGFNSPVFINDSILAIGADMYLGADYPLYKQFTYEYMIANMKRENIVPDALTAYLFTHFPLRSQQNRLLDNMIYRGKILYLVSQFLPNEKPENIMGYTPAQWKWCKDNERGIWASLIEQKLLFSSDVQIIQKFLNDAPFTSPVTQNSPGRLGTWIGWQIVSSYMNNNSQMTLNDLAGNNDYQMMLEKSKYKP